MIIGENILSKRADPGSNTKDLTYVNEKDSSPFQNLRRPLSCPFYGN